MLVRVLFQFIHFTGDNGLNYHKADMCPAELFWLAGLLVLLGHQPGTANCARHNFPIIRGWMQMVMGTKWFIFLMFRKLCRAQFIFSAQKRLLKVWRARLLHIWPCRYVPPPPLSGANCQPFPPPGGPGPPASKMASFSPGSTHTPSPLSVTLHNYWLDSWS